MAYTTKYNIDFNSRSGNRIKIEMQYDGFGGTATYLTGTTVELSYLNQDSSKNAGIKDSFLTYGIFLEGADPITFETSSQIECKVVLSVNDEVNWRGWLDNTGLQYTLLDNVELKLKARDGLHLLNTVDEKWLLTFGTNGFESPVAYIAKCLSYTLLNLDFHTWIDIYPDTYQVRGAGGDIVGANDPLDSFVIHSTTFQRGAVSYDDPYTVLNKFCESFKCVLFQARGAWHIVYVEDWVRNLGLTGTRWNYLGVAQDYSSNQRYRINVGAFESTKLINEDALVSYQRPAKKVKTSFYYDLPLTLIKNLDLSQTTGSVSGPNYIESDLDLWTVVSGTVKVRKYVDADNNELRRILHFGVGNIQSPIGLCSNGDKVRLTADVEQATGNTFFIGIRVVSGGMSPTYYYLKSDGKWKIGTTTWELIGFTPVPFQGQLYYESVDAIPANGSIQIYISSTSTNNAIWNMNMKYEYKPLSNFTASGHYHQSSQTTNFKNEIEDIINISDCDGLSPKGAMITNAVGALLNWKHNGVSEKLRFSKLINRATYKFNYRNFYIVEAALMNNISSNYLFSPLNTFILDVFPNLEFMCATIKVDLVNDTSEVTLVELLNTSNTDDYDSLGTEEFKWLDFVADLPEAIEKTNKLPLDWRYGAVGVLVQLIIGKKRNKDR